MGKVFAVSRWGVRRTLPAVIVVLTFCGGFLVPVTAADDSGPQLNVDRIVVERGPSVTITLNGFPAGQRFVVSVRSTMYTDQQSVVATLPVSVDANGGGAVSVQTAGLPSGDYFATATGEGAGAPQVGVATAFAVIDPGTLGPRIVRVYPSPSDDQGLVHLTDNAA